MNSQGHGINSQGHENLCVNWPIANFFAGLSIMILQKAVNRNVGSL